MNQKEVRISHIQTSTYHLLQRSRKSVQWILRQLVCNQKKIEITEGQQVCRVG